MLDFSRKDSWTIVETSFDPAFMGKVETCFAQGNGYLGLRAVSEEKYLGETRDLLVAGTYDRFSEEIRCKFIQGIDPDIRFIRPEKHERF